MLDDGCRFKAIIGYLVAQGHPGIKPNNLSEWKKGGFKEWLEQDWRLAREERIRELSYDIATTNEGSKTQEAAIQIAASFLFQVFLKFDPDTLTKQLNLKPHQITAVLNAFTRINRRGTELDMIKEYKRQQEEQRRAAGDPAAAPAVPPGLSDEGQAQIERDYNLC